MINLPERCCEPRCNQRPLWYQVVRIWATGYPKTSAPMELSIGMSYCAIHKESFRFQDQADLHEIVLATARATGKVAPDLSTAEVQMLPIVDFRVTS